MRFYFAVMADRRGPISATAQEMASIDAFNDKIESSGQRVFAAGIAGPETATVFDNRDGAGLASPGPIDMSEHFMAGFWIIEADTLEAAHVLAEEASIACNRRIEVRPLLG